MQVRYPMTNDIKVLRYDTVRGVVALAYKVSPGLWRLYHVPVDEFRLLFGENAYALV